MFRFDREHTGLAHWQSQDRLNFFERSFLRVRIRMVKRSMTFLWKREKKEVRDS